jgi:2-iminobutanoate/2-iminopropanoate deaminase
MAKKAVFSPYAPKVVGPYPQAILHDSKYTLELSGQIGVDPATGRLVEGGIEAETEQTFKNIAAVLAEIGWDFSNVVKARVYLADMADYKTMNELYAKKFMREPPARVAIAAKQLPAGAHIEIECTAVGERISERISHEKQ